MEDATLYRTRDFENRVYLTRESYKTVMEQILKKKPQLFVKKPIPVQAYQIKDRMFIVQTDDGDMIGNRGDYLVVGVDEKEIYVSKKEIFESTYKIIS